MHFQGCRIYSVQCSGGPNHLVDAFWQGMAYKTYGHHLSLSSFSNVFDFIMAIAFKEQGAEQLEVFTAKLAMKAGYNQSITISV